MDLATQIYRLRKELLWTQADLAKASGFSLRSINEWESGNREPKERHVREIVRSCQIELDKRAKKVDFYDGENEPTIDKPLEPKYIPVTQKTYTLAGEAHMKEYIDVCRELIEFQREEIGRLKSELSAFETKKEKRVERR